MKYTVGDFQRDLQQEIDKGYDAVRIAQAAFSIYQDPALEMSINLNEAVYHIMMMEAGPEFEMSEDEVMEFTDKLTDN